MDTDPEIIRRGEEESRALRKARIVKTLVKVCSKGKAENIEKFLEYHKNVDVNQTLNWRENLDSCWPCLIYACRALNLEVIKKLLELGADPTFVAKGGLTPMMAIVKADIKESSEKSVSCAKALVEDGCIHVQSTPKYRNRTLLTYTVMAQNQDLLDYFLDQGTDPNEPDGSGDLPLNLAVRMNHKGMVESLKYHKANLFASDGAGKTAIEVFKQTTDCDREIGQLITYWCLDYRRKLRAEASLLQLQSHHTSTSSDSETEVEEDLGQEGAVTMKDVDLDENIMKPEQVSLPIIITVPATKIEELPRKNVEVDVKKCCTLALYMVGFAFAVVACMQKARKC